MIAFMIWAWAVVGFMFSQASGSHAVGFTISSVLFGIVYSKIGG